jgi:hypothetical protein
MADRTRVFKSSDWSVWVSQPETGSFILDFSELNSADILGTTGNTFSAVDLSLASILLTEGSQITQGIFHTIQPSSLMVVFNTKDFHSNLASKFLTGSSIELRLKNENTTSLLDQTVYFMGYIDSADATIAPGADYASITVSATSKTSVTMNKLVSITKNTTSEKGVILLAALSSYGLVTNTDVNHFANTATEEKPIGEWLADSLISGIYYPTQVGYFGGMFKEYITNKVSETFDGLTYTQYNDYTQAFDIVQSYNPQSGGTQFNEDNTNNIEFGWSGAGSPTGVSLSLTSNTATTYKKNAASTSQPGQFTYTSALDVKDSTELTNIGNQLISMTQKYLPIQITSVYAYDNQNISFTQQDYTIHGGLTFSAWFKPKNEPIMGQQISLEYPTYGISDVVLVTGKTHEITPDYWQITYDLWKGFTA